MSFRALLLVAALSVAAPVLSLAEDTTAAPPADAGAAAAAPLAASTGAPEPVAKACAADMTSLCASSAEGKGGKFRCLIDNKDKLSPDCASAVKTVQDQRKAMRAACRTDADKLCQENGVALKGGGLTKCLRSKTADLSKPCAEALATMGQPVAAQ